MTNNNPRSSCRFHSFLLFLGQPSSSIRDIRVTSFCRIIGEFALEYRTTRERVLTLKRKRATHRERTKTRGKMITEVTASLRNPRADSLNLCSNPAVPSSQTEKFSGAAPPQDSPAPVSITAEVDAGQEEEHENMKNLLISSCSSSLTVDSRGLRRSRGVRSKTLSPLRVHLF